MEHEIRFCVSADGVELATWRYGHGSPIVVASRPGGMWPVSALSEHPLTRGIYDRLADQHAVVLYDPRGSGLSQRDATDYSSQAAIEDLRAVIDSHDLHDFALVGWRGTARTAVEYAALWPDRSSKLVLRDPVLQPRDQILLPRDKALGALLEADFEFYLQVVALSHAGWEAGKSLAEVSLAGTSREAFLASREHDNARNDQSSPSLAAVACETLVVHSSSTASMFPLARARRITSDIPHARMAIIEGGSLYDPKDAEEFARVVLEFIDGAPRDAAARPTHAAGTAIILFTDIVSSTELTERMGDVAFRDASRALDARLRAAIRDAGGTAIDGKLLGDGVLATFPSAAQAIDGARRCLTLSAASELGLHMGLHAGDVIREEGNVFGGAVNIASRICGLSAPGEILVSDVVRGMARSSAIVEFEDRGEQEMKGVGEPVRVFAVRSLD